MKKLSDNKDLILIDKSKMSEAEWLADRFRGIGGSEVATILGLNPYGSAIELFYQKIEETPGFMENEAMFMGKILEGIIAELWQYYSYENLDFVKMLENYKKKEIQRHAKEIHNIISNPKYPNLFANIDRLIIDSEGNEGILEVKTVSGFTSKVWESGISPSYLIQLQTYMLITELEYGEIATLKDGRYMEIFPVKANKEIQEGIIEKCNIFWDKVIQAKELNKENKPFEHLEPEPDDTEAYEKFMKARYVTKPITIEGTPELLLIAQNLKELNKEIKEIEKKYQLGKNTIISAMRDADTIDFGSAGNITYKANAKGVKVFNNNIK